MTQGSPLGLISNNGVLSMGGVDPNTGMLRLSDGQTLSRVSPSAVLAQPLPSMNAANEAETSQFGSSYGGPTLIGDFPGRNQNQMSENTRKKTSLLDRFRSIPGHIHMKSGAAMLGADDFPSGLAAMADVDADYQATQTPEAKQARMIEMYKNLMDAESKKSLALNRASKKSKQDIETSNTINQMQNALVQFETSLKGIEKYPDTVGGSLGNPNNFIYDLLGIDFGSLTGTPEASIRSQLQSLKVDEQLLKAALTKGAISDREMALFGSDQPKFSSAPSLWRDWLTRRRNLIAAIIERLENNMSVPNPASKDQLDKALKVQEDWLNSLGPDADAQDTSDTTFSAEVQKALDSINN